MLNETLELSDLKAFLPLFGLRVAGEMGGSILVTDSKSNHYTVWALCDNGGEINVWKVNHWETMRSVATSHSVAGFRNPDAGTACYRIRCVVDGTAIDYDRRMPDGELAHCLTPYKGSSKSASNPWHCMACGTWVPKGMLDIEGACKTCQARQAGARADKTTAVS